MGFGTPVPLLVGIVLILLGIGLFFLDNFKPGYKRDSDTVYAVLLLTVGILSLLIWNAGFAEALQLMVSAGTLIALMIERIQNRSINNDPLRSMGGRAPSRREVDRPSRPYRGGYDDNPRDLRVELDDDLMPSIDDSTWSRRIPGAREDRSSSRNAYSQSAYLDQLTDESRSARRSSTTSRSSNYDDERPHGEERSSRRRPLQLEGDMIDSPSPGDTDDTSNGYSNRRRRSTGNRRPLEEQSSPTDLSLEDPPRSSRRRRVRPEGSRPEPRDGDYVDYKPLNSLDYPDQEMDNSSNFDDPPEYK